MFFSGLPYADADTFLTLSCRLSNLKGGGLKTGACLCSAEEQSGLISHRRRGLRKNDLCSRHCASFPHSRFLEKYFCSPPLLFLFCHPDLCFFILACSTIEAKDADGRVDKGTITSARPPALRRLRHLAQVPGLCWLMAEYLLSRECRKWESERETGERGHCGTVRSRKSNIQFICTCAVRC